MHNTTSLYYQHILCEEISLYAIATDHFSGPGTATDPVSVRLSTYSDTKWHDTLVKLSLSTIKFDGQERR